MAVWPSDSIRTKNWGTEILTDSDLEAQLDLLHAYFQAALNASTGHNHDGTSNAGPKIPVTNLTVGSQAQGDVIYASSSSAWARLGAGTSGQFLKTQGAAANPIWGDAISTLTVTNALSGSVIQTVSTQTGAVSTTTTQMPWDDTIPQNTEGGEFMTLAVTPNNASNKLIIDVVLNASSSVASDPLTVALFQDSTANALAAVSQSSDSTANGVNIKLTHYMTAGTTSATTFKVRAGIASAGTVTFNGQGSARKLGGVMVSSINIREIKA